jgi:hypothetical protein
LQYLFLARDEEHTREQDQTDEIMKKKEEGCNAKLFAALNQLQSIVFPVNFALHICTDALD